MRWRERVRAVGLVVQGAALAAALAAGVAMGQDTPAVSGAVAFLQNTNKGSTSYDPTIMPVALVPVTRMFLFETRGSFLESVTPRTNGESDRTKLNRNFAFLQLDVLANSHATLVLGKFLTPFATYNERLSPIWIGNFQSGPLDFPIGNLGSAATGGEVRGAAVSSNKVNVDYATFYSATVTGGQFGSSHAAGGRVDVYFPGTRVEIGSSYDHMFAGTHQNASGAHFWWQTSDAALAIKSEYAHGTHAQGYWIEAAYRLQHWTGPESVLGRLQPVFRMNQVFRNSPDSTDGLPAVDTQRADFALDYFLPHEVRINTSYSRQFASTGNGNIWTTGVIYRFVFPRRGQREVMRRQVWMLAGVTWCALLAAAGQDKPTSQTRDVGRPQEVADALEKEPPAKTQAAPTTATEDAGERKYQQNCSRCHKPPDELSRRVTGTVLLHMRVRAGLSETDEKAILHYMMQ